MRYLPGMIFLFLVSATISIPFAISIKRKSMAVLCSVCLSTLILKGWAYVGIGGIDLGFLSIQMIIGLCAALIVHFRVDKIRRQAQISYVQHILEKQCPFEHPLPFLLF